MTDQRRRVFEAQRLTHLWIDGCLYRREPWDPVAMAVHYGSDTFSESTLCNDCGVAAGQLHIPFCDMDVISVGPDPGQVIGRRLTADSFVSGDGGPC